MTVPCAGEPGVGPGDGDRGLTLDAGVEGECGGCLDELECGVSAARVGVSVCLAVDASLSVSTGSSEGRRGREPVVGDQTRSWLDEDGMNSGIWSFGCDDFIVGVESDVDTDTGCDSGFDGLIVDDDLDEEGVARLDFSSGARVCTLWPKRVGLGKESFVTYETLHGQEYCSLICQVASKPWSIRLSLAFEAASARPVFQVLDCSIAFKSA